MSGRLLWDVDTQVDFVHADGKLPVPGAESVAPAMARLVRWAEDEGVTHLATADDHELTDPEITDDPDYATTYPPHCLRGTPGAAKIPETVQRDPFPVSLTPYPPGLVPELVRGRRELLVLKKTYSACSNPNLEPVDVTLELHAPTGRCVDAAVWSLESGQRLALAISELFDRVRVPRGASVSVTASLPVEAFGLTLDERTGSITPHLLADGAPGPAIRQPRCRN